MSLTPLILGFIAFFGLLFVIAIVAVLALGQSHEEARDQRDLNCEYHPTEGGQ